MLTYWNYFGHPCFLCPLSRSCGLEKSDHRREIGPTVSETCTVHPITVKPRCFGALARAQHTPRGGDRTITDKNSYSYLDPFGVTSKSAMVSLARSLGIPICGVVVKLQRSQRWKALSFA